MMKKAGQNRGYIDELHRSYLADPQSVSEAWRDYFADYDPGPAVKPTSPAAPKPAASDAPPVEPDAEPLRGITARIAENMVASLEVPTATSAREVPVKMLEENRRVVNQHQSTVAASKISFTHLIAWAIVRSLHAHPGMNTTFVMQGGIPHRVPRSTLNFGIAVDMERKGKRILLVPNIKNAAALDFPGFVAAFNELVRRGRDNTLTTDDFQGTTLTLTNPGMIGTALSVPRLMQGQGAIFGVGSIGFPAEYAGMAPEMKAQLGLSKVMTVTSTYDHRVIQGAESGAFLRTLESLLQGADGFYDEIFTSLGVPHEPIRWSNDQNPQLAAGGGATDAIAKQAGVLQLIRAYRVRGHLWADLDPLGYVPEPHRELELSHYGLTIWDLDRPFICGGLAGQHGTLPLREILDTLEHTYCRHIGVEYMHIQDPESRGWLQERMERSRNLAPLDRDAQFAILRKLNAAEALETFLHTNYVGQKRFSLEGAETLIPMLDRLAQDSARGGIEDVVIGMAHRGRLNVLTNVIGKSYGQVFREFEGDLDPDTTHGSGDVKYHLGASGEYETPDGTVTLSLASNPSHLEAVDPVVEGMVRARQDERGDERRERVLPVLIHGDAAFSGQGVVAETLNLSQLQGYRTGGTIHIVVNNQIGFTTGPADLRSSDYSTDVAKMMRSPIFHVNGDHPESAIRVIELALAFRQRFKRDVVIDLVCYRRWGHNEGDDPSYTHPTLYAKIEHHRSVRKQYTDQLLRRGDFDMATAEQALEDFRDQLRAVHDEVRGALSADEATAREDTESTEGVAGPMPDVDTSRESLERVLDGLQRTPADFEMHPKLARQLAKRRDRFEDGTIDWAFAEALAFGTLALDGVPVRLSGEDSGRGTFSQRHSVLHDYRTGEDFVPLANLSDDQAPFQVFDSLLSEFAVLGFEYGYGVERPNCLVLWEAQFGDFANGAQVIIDQFIASAEDKWAQRCGVVLLLPHGYEGQGPEHSSARLERFLQLAARGNIRVAYPSTPAQYFHLLRLQAKHPERKPLIVMTPKSLLRHRACVSDVPALVEHGFEGVLDDPGVQDPSRVRRVVFCSGKVWYDLDETRREHGRDDVALLRFELLYPVPRQGLETALARYDGVETWIWAQEEPGNMGAWSFIRDRLDGQLPGDARLRYCGRPRSASPATGSHRRHLAEQRRLVREALGMDVDDSDSRSPAASVTNAG